MKERSFSPASPRPFPRSLALLFAVVAGLAVGNAYAVQPLLDTIATAFSLAPGTAGAIVTATQVGLTMGLLLIVPLGDLLRRRRLVPLQLLIGAAGLSLVAVARWTPLLLAAMAIVGASSVVAQVLVAYAAALTGDSDRGRAVGLVTSGIISGILLSRAVAGAIAQLAGWRAVYLASAVATVLLAAMLARRLPRGEPGERMRPAAGAYFSLVASTIMLVARMPLLRVRGALAMLTFAAFSTLWSALALPLSAPPHELSHAAIGLFGLAGAAGALAASRAGRLADRGHGEATAGTALVLLLLSWPLIAMLDRSLAALALGVVLLDLAVQAIHVINQSSLLAAAGAARSRVTAAYMLFYSLGSALGAIAATTVYSAAGWTGVCFQGAALSATALLLWWLTNVSATSRVAECHGERA